MSLSYEILEFDQGILSDNLLILNDMKYTISSDTRRLHIDNEPTPYIVKAIGHTNQSVWFIRNDGSLLQYINESFRIVPGYRFNVLYPLIYLYVDVLDEEISIAALSRSEVQLLTIPLNIDPNVNYEIATIQLPDGGIQRDLYRFTYGTRNIPSLHYVSNQDSFVSLPIHNPVITIMQPHTDQVGEIIDLIYSPLLGFWCILFRVDNMTNILRTEMIEENNFRYIIDITLPSTTALYYINSNFDNIFVIDYGRNILMNNEGKSVKVIDSFLTIKPVPHYNPMIVDANYYYVIEQESESLLRHLIRLIQSNKFNYTDIERETLPLSIQSYINE